MLSLSSTPLSPSFVSQVLGLYLTSLAPAPLVPSMLSTCPMTPPGTTLRMLSISHRLPRLAATTLSAPPLPSEAFPIHMHYTLSPLVSFSHSPFPSRSFLPTVLTLPRNLSPHLPVSPVLSLSPTRPFPFVLRPFSRLLFYVPLDLFVSPQNFFPLCPFAPSRS